MALTVMTWNLKGSEQPDPTVVIQHVRAMRVDVLLLQEVQRHQARAIARGLGAASLRWGFKHWPVLTWPEGMAVIGVSRPLVARCHPLTRRWQPWSWRRRIALTAQFAPIGSAALASPGATDADGPHPAARFVNLHLSPGKAPELRVREVHTVLDILSSVGGVPQVPSSQAAAVPLMIPTVVAGDLNDRPGTAPLESLQVAGLHDAWSLAHPDQPEKLGATNWSGGREGEPRRRIDYVLVSEGIAVQQASVPRPGDDGFERFRTLSDHLPLTVTLDL